MRTTYTYTTLAVSQAAYDEIRAKLAAAQYDHAFHEEGRIDMHGIALKAQQRLCDCDLCGAQLETVGAGFCNICRYTIRIAKERGNFEVLKKMRPGVVFPEDK